MSKRRMDLAYRAEQRHNSGMWDSWDGWNHNPAPPPPLAAGHQQGYNQKQHNSHPIPPPAQYNGHYQHAREIQRPYNDGGMRSHQQYRFSLLTTALSHWLSLHLASCINVLFSERGLCSARTPAPATRSQATRVTLTPGLIPSSLLTTSPGRPRPQPRGL